MTTRRLRAPRSGSAITNLPRRGIRPRGFASAFAGLFATIWCMPILATPVADTAAVFEDQQPADEIANVDRDCDRRDDDSVGHDSIKRKFLVVGLVNPVSPAIGLDPLGLTVQLTDRADNSIVIGADTHGRFKFKDLAPGKYTISPIQEGYFFEPSDITVAVRTCRIKRVKFVQELEGFSAEQLREIDAQPRPNLSAETTTLPDENNLADYAASHGITVAELEASLGITPAPPRPATSDASSGRALAPPPENKVQVQVPLSTNPQTQKDNVIASWLLLAQDFACGRNAMPCDKWDYPADPPNRGI
jgi:hypothetical protein